MGFDGTEGRAISLSTATELTKEYRAQNPGNRAGHFFGKNIIEKILGQEGCVGIRIYYGIDSNTGKRELVLVGANDKEDDILDLIADVSVACPNRCSSPNDLNC